MNEIYVSGHRNPDTDSIVASMAYARLRNALGDREYKAVRIGAINDETQHMLDHFGFEPPEYIKSMRTQVCDLDFDRPPELNCSVTMDLAWRTMREGEIATMPIVNDDGTLYGMLSAGDIASYDMETIYSSHIEELPVFNLLSVLEGRLVNECSNLVNSVSGDVLIALPQSFEDPGLISPDTILICGDQPEIIARALEHGVNTLIICQADVSHGLADSAAPTCIISTPLDARQVSRLIFQAIPIDRVCKTTSNVVCFHLADYIDDVKEVLLKSRYRCYPVLDENEHVVGTLSRFHLLNPRRKRVVLVDHNEASQSVVGLDQVDILEIIDHHRLADIQTGSPIYFRNEPVGSTATIISSMYQEKGLMPPSNLAGLLAAAIVADTVMFKSPTSTPLDHRMAERMARIANVSLDDLGKEIFAASTSDDKPADALLFADFKDFHIADHDFGISQITCVDSSHLLQRSEEFLELMRQTMHKRGYSFMILMLTDVLVEGSHLLYVGDEDIMTQAFGVHLKDHACFLPNVVSRKKQVVPMLSALWG